MGVVLPIGERHKEEVIAGYTVIRWSESETVGVRYSPI